MQLISFINFACLLQIRSVIAVSLYYKTEIEDIPQISSSTDCSQYKTDNEIIKSFPYHVDLNPVFRDSTTTYALMNDTRNIYYMEITNQKLIPSTIYCLKHLKELYVRKTRFCDSKQRLPAEIQYFASSLTHLGIYNTNITHLPKQIGKLKHLQFLELSNINLNSLPYVIGNLLSLTYLSLPNNKLKFLPKTIVNLRLLHQIILTNNTYLRSIQSINGLPSLTILDARYCSIKNLSLYLPNLTDLHMSNNNLEDLDGIETLGNGTSEQKTFHFDKNQIRSIPPQIRHINNLYWLNLNHNQLDNLPTDIFEVTTLSHLYIQDNRFRPDQKELIKKEFKDKNPELDLHL